MNYIFFEWQSLFSGLDWSNSNGLEPQFNYKMATIDVH